MDKRKVTLLPPNDRARSYENLFRGRNAFVEPLLDAFCIKGGGGRGWPPPYIRIAVITFPLTIERGYVEHCLNECHSPFSSGMVLRAS